MNLKRELEAVVEGLLARTAKGESVTLDALGEAIGDVAAGSDEIDEMMRRLEADGRVIVGPSGGGTSGHLRKVLLSARELMQGLGRRPTAAEIAKRVGLSVDQVVTALALGRVMGR